MEVLWYIEAVRDVPVKGFVVKVGEVPNGFKQIIPGEESRFTPDYGVEYIIVINANYKPRAWSGMRKWIAD